MNTLSQKTSRTIGILAVIIALTPFLGVPGSWKTFIVTVLGFSIALMVVGGHRTEVMRAFFYIMPDRFRGKSSAAKKITIPAVQIQESKSVHTHTGRTHDSIPEVNLHIQGEQRQVEAVTSSNGDSFTTRPDIVSKALEESVPRIAPEITVIANTVYPAENTKPIITKPRTRKKVSSQTAEAVSHEEKSSNHQVTHTTSSGSGETTTIRRMRI